MSDLNNVVLVGRLVRDPEMSVTPSGVNVCKFGLAVNGRKKEDVSFLNCVAWQKTAEIVNQYCKKGRQVAVSGRLSQRSWEKDGRKQSAVEVVVEQLQLLGAKAEPRDAMADDYDRAGGTTRAEEEALPF